MGLLKAGGLKFGMIYSLQERSEELHSNEDEIKNVKKDELVEL